MQCRGLGYAGWGWVTVGLGVQEAVTRCTGPATEVRLRSHTPEKSWTEVPAIYEAQPETLQPTRSQTKYMVSKIFQDCPRRPARYYRCLSGIERSKIQDVKPNQPKVFYDILMGRSEAPAAPSAASASRAAARLMDDDSGTLTAKMLKPHHISKSKTPGVDVMCGFQLGKKLEVCGHGWVMLC